MNKNYAAMVAEAKARTEAYDAKVRALPEYEEVKNEFDREYSVALLMENARKHAKLTQAQVAERMGTTQSSIARMTRTNITINTLARYLKACGAQLKVAACYM